jgi:molecular chaperone DnaK
MNEVIVGIDLGTTNSAIGVVDSGFPLLLADEEGKRITPSAVWYGKNGEVTVGRKALRHRNQDGSRVITSVKRFIGRELNSEEQETLLGKSPEEVSADILRELKRIAELRLGHEIKKAVITVPAYFHDGQRSATKRAGELAGLEVVRIINEPTAAALAYGLNKIGDKSRIAVYDFGGGTFDLSILEMQDGVFQVLSTRGDTKLGGDDIDAIIVQKTMVRAKISDPSKELIQRWQQEAERVKCALSRNNEEIMRIPFYDGSSSWENVVTRNELEEWIKPLINQTITCCRKAMVDANVQPESIQQIILVGGSTRIPAVRKAVSECFSREPDISQHPDEAIALGATIQAGLLSGAMSNMILLDVTPLSLGIETLGGLMNILIPRNTTIPCKAGEMFTNAAAGQKSMIVRVLQGEREMAKDNWDLGNVIVPFQSAEKGQARIGVQFRLDENGILEVLARDIATGIDQILTIKSSAVVVSDDHIEKMISESVEYAFEDMAERVLKEAILKAEELLPAVESALLIAGDFLSEEERKEIEAAVAQVKNELISKNANLLKSAVQILDKATEQLAARVVEIALEKNLTKKMRS